MLGIVMFRAKTQPAFHHLKELLIQQMELELSETPEYEILTTVLILNRVLQLIIQAIIQIRSTVIPVHLQTPEALPEQQL
jgi:hypothetical protein